MPRGQDKLLVFTPPSRQDAAGLRRVRNPDPRDGFQFNRTKSYELCDRRLFDDDGRQPTPLIGPGGGEVRDVWNLQIPKPEAEFRRIQ